MTSTFTTNKTLELPANGDYVNTWNIPVNGDMTVIDTALGGITNLNATAGSATLTYTQYRPLTLSVSGAVAANVVYTIPSGVGGQWIVRNNMTDSSGGPWDLVFQSGGGGTYVVAPRGYTTTIFSDGVNINFSDSRSLVAGSNRQIQYNNNGVFGASSTFVYDGNGNLGVGTASPSTSIHVYKSGTASFRLQNTTTTMDSYVDASYGVFGTITNSPLIFTTNNVERIRVEAGGNVGVGTIAPSNYGNAYIRNLTVYFTDQNITLGAYYQASVAQYGIINSGDTNNANPMPLVFQGAGIERMRIDNSGNLLVGTTTVLNYAKITVVNNNPQIVARNSGATAGKFWNCPYIDVDNNIYIINQDNVGVVLLDGSSSWAANSDERLKDIIAPITSALESVKSLRAVRYSWKSDADKEPHVGLIAQDVQKVLPEVVHSVKLPSSSDDTEYLTVSYSEIVPLLVAALQELTTKNYALEARLAKLENAQ
jgi:hypothetical protein